MMNDLVLMKRIRKFDGFVETNVFWNGGLNHGFQVLKTQEFQHVSQFRFRGADVSVGEEVRVFQGMHVRRFLVQQPSFRIKESVALVTDG